VNIDVFKYFCNIFNQTPNFFVLIPDLATPVAHAFTKAIAFSWLKLRQVWLFIGLLISSKKASILFFDTIQQNMIEGLPVCFIWEAKNYYKATINGNDVTFDKTPVVNSDARMDDLNLPCMDFFPVQDFLSYFRLKNTRR
jgi:hypothetical protein